ncbi:MAG TPA: heavy metal translocating P-type ATPase [Patescibacteria group bacterium]|nr:heavy metal translocating P-type ATPase [Patescibacteria group bacterium]
MIKKAHKFAKLGYKRIRQYPLFSIASAAFLAGCGLYFSGQITASRWLLAVVAVAEVLPLLWRMGRDLREGTYGIDILAAAAIIASVAFRQYWPAIVIVLMLTGGEALEHFAEHRAKTELDALLSRAPKLAHLLKSGKEVDIPVGRVQRGDKLIIKAGEVVPVDAVIIEGKANFDESSLTGESLPQAKKENDQLLSGSLSIDGAVTVKALRPASDSQYEEIIKLVKAAANSKAPFIRLADRFSVPFTVLAFILATGAWIAGHQSIRFLDVLVVATPCPLILAAPIAVISGMSRSARHGIIVKNGGSLERLARAETIAFDKTGTLTKGNLAVDKVNVFNHFKPDEALRFAAILEQSSSHVLAQAIIAAASKAGIRLARAKNIREYPGSGLSARVNGRIVLVGNLSFLGEQKIKLTGYGSSIKNLQTSTYVAVDGELAGAISFKDELRPESKSTLQALTKMGIKHLIMLTGDNTNAAKAIAKKLGLSEFEAETLPADKLRLMEKLPYRPVVFVGDGVNDAPVLASADVGIAIGAKGETAASQSADMVIMKDDISYVATALSIAQRTFSIARQSILVGIALSIVLMLVFSTGRFKPIYGAVLQEVVDVLVIFNALRAHGSGSAKHLNLLKLMHVK